MGSHRCPISKRHAEVLRALSRLPKKERQILLRYIDLKLTRCICECAYNVLKGNVPLDDKQKAYLKKHVTVLRRLARTGDKITEKKKIIQTGGGHFLPTLLIPILTTVLADILR